MAAVVLAAGVTDTLIIACPEGAPIAGILRPSVCPATWWAPAPVFWAWELGWERITPRHDREITLGRPAGVTCWDLYPPAWVAQIAWSFCVDPAGGIS